MPKNRYDDKLREGNQLILDLTPANYVLRIELSLEVKKLLQDKNSKILEIGVGEGDLTKYVLKENNGISIDCLDISQDMLDLANENLSKFKDRLNFICADALGFLKENSPKYDLIISSWTIHNFPWSDKLSLFQEIFSSLNFGGKFLLMDKLYPDISEQSKQLFDLQIKRYVYLSEELKNEIIAHEKQDLLDDYRMEETQTINELKKIGFKNIKILDRVERDVLLMVEK